MVDESEPVWSQLQPASFEVDGERVLFPMWDSYEIEDGLRVAAREVPFLDGRQLDTTGTEGEVVSVAIPFFNSILLEDPVYGLATPLYPDRLERLCALFRSGRTGSLNCMTRRNMRVKAVRWRRSGKIDERDGEALSVTFWTDNEAKLDGPSIETVSVKVNLTRVLNEAEFEADRAGMRSAAWEDITTLAAQLDAAMSAPSEFADDIRQKAHRVHAACDRVLASHSRNIEGRSQFLDCAAYPAKRAIEALRDFSARAEGEARERRPKTITRTYQHDYPLYEIAMMEGQDPGRVAYLNSQIEDQNWVPAKTPVLLEVA